MNEKFKLFASERRQNILTILGMYDEGDTVSTRHLAKIIAAKENKLDVQQVTTSDYESAYNGMIQNHLPRMADHEVIDYDRDRKIVMVTDDTLTAASELMSMRGLVG